MTLLDIQQKVDKAAYAYYTVGSPVMDDTVYDSLIKELRQLNPNDKRLKKVGASIRDNILEKQAHSIKMDSLDKATNIDEWNSWIKNTLKKNNFSTELLEASLKIDGGSVSLEYRNGQLISAVTRGDGLYGETITPNAISFKGLPNKSTFSGFVRGEVALNMDDWNSIDPDKTSNPRNLPVGIMRRKDGSQSEWLSFYAFRLYDLNGNIIGDTQSEMHKNLKELGFNTVQSFVGTAAEVWNWYLEIAKIRSTLNFQIDGITIFINDIKKQLSLGSSEHAPRGAVAIKFEPEEVKTTLLKVQFETGHSGALTPVAQVVPTQIGGTTVEFASLYNIDNIENLELCINDEIILTKSGDIIPCITKVINRPPNRIPIITPTKCPCCNGKVEKKSNISGVDSVAIYCVNEDCPAQVSGKVSKFVKSLDCQGLGDGIIEDLINNKLINTAADLYTLKNKEDELANLMLSGKTRLGEKRAKKILDNIENKRKLPLNEFLGSLGVSSLGKRRVSIVCESVGGKMNDLESWLDGKTLSKYADESSLPNAAHGICKELFEKRENINQYIINGVEIEKVKKSNVKDGALLFCLTGPPLPTPDGEKVTKEYYHDAITKSGNLWTSAYTKSVNYLVTADKNNITSKLEKAKKNGTAIIDHHDLLKLIGH